MPQYPVLIPLWDTCGHQEVLDVVAQRVDHMPRALGDGAEVLHQGLRDRVTGTLVAIPREHHAFPLGQPQGLSGCLQRIPNQRYGTDGDPGLHPAALVPADPEVWQEVLYLHVFAPEVDDLRSPAPRAFEEPPDQA